MSIDETVSALARDATDCANVRETLELAAQLYEHLNAITAHGGRASYRLVAAQLLVGLLLTGAPNDAAAEIAKNLTAVMPWDKLRAFRAHLDGRG